MESKYPTAPRKRSRRDKDPPRASPRSSSPGKYGPSSSATRVEIGRNGIPIEDERDIYRTEASPHLPAVFRSAMILSHLEGFSAEEIGRLAGVQARAIEALLVRGRELMREEFIAYVKSCSGVLGIADRIEHSVGSSGPGRGRAYTDAAEP